MIKILSEEEKKRIIKRNQLIVGGMMISLLIISTVGYAFSNAGNDTNGSLTVDIQGISFTKENDYWHFIVNNNEFVTRYNPEEVASIPYLNYLTIQDYKDKPLYFAGETGEHTIELKRNLGGRFVLRMSEACVEGEICENDLPIKNCTRDNLIVYKKVVEENETETIYQEDKCTYIIARTEHQTQYTDVFLYKLLGLR